MSRPIVASARALLLAACATSPQFPPPSRPSAAPPVPPVSALVAEAWISPDVPGEELDSVITWVSGEGDTWLLATGKSTHRSEERRVGKVRRHGHACKPHNR